MPAAPCRPSSTRWARRWKRPTKPVIAIVGGAKVSTKIDLLENLVTKVDALVIGGGMANTFLHAQGIGVGKSLAREGPGAPPRCGSWKRPKAANCAIMLPVDAVVANEFAANAPSHAYGLDAIPADGMILDVGPQSIARINAAIDDAATLVWNGPLGAFEMTPFDQRHRGGGEARGRADEGEEADLGRGRRRHGRGAEPGRRGRRFHLRLDRGRRVSRMDGGQAPARRRSVEDPQVPSRSR